MCATWASGGCLGACHVHSKCLSFAQRHHPRLPVHLLPAPANTRCAAAILFSLARCSSRVAIMHHTWFAQTPRLVQNACKHQAHQNSNTFRDAARSSAHSTSRSPRAVRTGPPRAPGAPRGRRQFWAGGAVSTAASETSWKTPRGTCCAWAFG